MPHLSLCAEPSVLNRSLHWTLLPTLTSPWKTQVLDTRRAGGVFQSKILLFRLSPIARIVWKCVFVCVCAKAGAHFDPILVGHHCLPLQIPLLHMHLAIPGNFSVLMTWVMKKLLELCPVTPLELILLPQWKNRTAFLMASSISWGGPYNRCQFYSCD